MKKKLLAMLLALSLSGALLAGCGGKTEQTSSEAASGTAAQPAATQQQSTQQPSAAAPSSTSNQKDTGRKATNEITVGIAQDLDESLDPHTVVAAGTKEVMFNVFEGLVKPNSDGDLVPAVASDYTVSSDGLTYTFTLRQGVKFHNGQEVTLQDVLYSLNRCAEEVDGVRLVPALENVAEIKGEGDTVTITLAEPNFEFLAYLTLAILPEDYTEQATKPVGTGPFRFVSRAAQDSVVLERFEDYWGTPAKLDKVTYKINENAESLVLGLQSGALDVVSHLSTDQVAQLPANEFHVEEGTMNLVQAMYLNNAAAPLDDVRVRQALCYAVDVDQIIDLAFDGYGHPIGSSMYPAFSKYFDDSLTGYYQPDPAKAKELLTEAGYPNGFDLTITVPKNYDPHMATAEVIVEQLKAVGINAKIDPIEWASWLSDVYSGRQFQATVVGVDASNMTARALLERFNSEAGNNFINYNNAEYDELFKKAISSADDAEQTAAYKAMEKNLTENAANVYIQDMSDLVAVRNGIAGLEFYPIYVLDVSTLYYE